MGTYRYYREALAKKKQVLSIEFFPPKTEKSGQRFIENAKLLRTGFRPDFVSITYGAGGSTRENTLEYATLLKEKIGFEVMPHLTCVGQSRTEIYEILSKFSDAGFNNLMTLRGDPPKSDLNFKQHPDGLRYASDLVAFIRKNYSHFCLGVAGYPEMHTQSNSLGADIKNLKNKIELGASFVITQLFFNNADYFSFVKSCRAAGITVPIVPGILPIHSLSKIISFCKFCGSSLPSALEKKLNAAGGDKDAEEDVGMEWAYQQIRELLEKNAPGFHLYSLNRPRAALEIIERLRTESIVD